MSNKVKLNKKKKKNKADVSLGEPLKPHRSRYFERHSYKGPDVNVTNVNYRGKV